MLIPAEQEINDNLQANITTKHHVEDSSSLKQLDTLDLLTKYFIKEKGSGIKSRTSFKEMNIENLEYMHKDFIKVLKLLESEKMVHKMNHN